MTATNDTGFYLINFIISHQSSVISHQSSVISHQSSVIVFLKTPRHKQNSPTLTGPFFWPSGGGILRGNWPGRPIEPWHAMDGVSRRPSKLRRKEGILRSKTEKQGWLSFGYFSLPPKKSASPRRAK